MNWLKSFMLSIAMITVLWAKDSTIILQNGLNGYDGCEDTYAYSNYYDSDEANVNFEGETTLKVFYGKLLSDSIKSIDKNR